MVDASLIVHQNANKIKFQNKKNSRLSMNGKIFIVKHKSSCNHDSKHNK